MQEGTSLRQPFLLTWQGGEMPARIPRLWELGLGEACALHAVTMPAAATSWPGAAARHTLTGGLAAHTSITVPEKTHW